MPHNLLSFDQLQLTCCASSKYVRDIGCGFIDQIECKKGMGR
jgi:hypothetical protein